MDTNREQEIAWQFIEGTDVSVFLTGNAGSGKTTFLRRVKELMPKRMAVVAPTGVAAINAGGMTIHSFFQLPIGIHLPGESVKSERNYYTMSKNKKNILRTLDLLIIDEISMVRCDLLDAIDEVMRKYRDRDKPFGGVQLLMIGDLQQLSPVATDKEWEMLRHHYENPYFFSSKALRQVSYVTIELKKIYRQSDQRFIELLANIRSGHLDPSTIAALNQRYIPDFKPPAGEDYIRLTTHNYKASQYNHAQLEKLGGTGKTFACEVEGDFPENSYPADSSLELKTGAQVMFIRNDNEGDRYFNGKIGKVVGFDDNGVVVKAQTDATPIHVTKSEWENTEYEVDEESKEIKEKVVGKFRQYPLRLAWSITIHKSQGLTFDHAILDINQSFAHGQVYVALSRCRTLEGLVLSSPLRLTALQTDKEVEAYVSHKLAAAERSYTQLDVLRARYFRTLLDEQFGFGKLQESVREMARLFSEYLYRSHAELTDRWLDAERTFAQDVVGVAVRFKNQYDRILTVNHEDGRDAALQERIHKAATYFADQLVKILVVPANSSKGISIGNKQTKKRFENAYERFMMELRLKCHTLSHLADHDFSVETYLRDKAHGLLPADTQTKKRRERQSKQIKKKEPKLSTQQLSLQMLRMGKNYDEIAGERMMAPSTIFGHLRGFVDSGELRWEDIVVPAHVKYVADLIEREGMPDPVYSYVRLLPREICSSEYYHIIQTLTGISEE